MFRVIRHNKPSKAECAAIDRRLIQRADMPLDVNGFVLTGLDDLAPDGDYPYLIILDFDVDHIATRIQNPFDTFHVRTGSGGHHLYFWCDKDLHNSQNKPITQRAKTMGLKGFDVRGRGGIIFAPGCQFTDHQCAYEIYENLPVREVSHEGLEKYINSFIWEPTDPYKHMREGFRTIMNGDWDLGHDMNKTTGINEWLYWSAFWREYLNCGGTVKDGVAHFNHTGLQRTFNEEETVRQLETSFFQKLGDKRPSNDFYFRLFPELEDGLTFSPSGAPGTDLTERVRTLENGFHSLNQMFQDLCKQMPKRRY